MNCGWSANKIANLIGEQQYNVSRIIRGERYASVPSYDDILKAYPIIVDYTRNKDIGELEEIKNYLLGLNGEVGELTDIFKRCYIMGKNMTRLM